MICKAGDKKVWATGNYKLLPRKPFTCPLWVVYLKSDSIKISMDSKGRALGNMFIERLWRTVKKDYVRIFEPDRKMARLYKGLKKLLNITITRKSNRDRPGSSGRIV